MICMIINISIFEALSCGYQQFFCFFVPQYVQDYDKQKQKINCNFSTKVYNTAWYERWWFLCRKHYYGDFKCEQFVEAYYCTASQHGHGG